MPCVLLVWRRVQRAHQKLLSPCHLSQRMTFGKILFYCFIVHTHSPRSWLTTHHPHRRSSISQKYFIVYSSNHYLSLCNGNKHRRPFLLPLHFESLLQGTIACSWARQLKSLSVCNDDFVCPWSTKWWRDIDVERIEEYVVELQIYRHNVRLFLR